MYLRLISFFFLINSVCGFSQRQPLRFSHITTEDGLSSSWVRCIFQDNMGFIWFGTGDGLNRYDGYSLKVFKAAPDNKNSLIHGGVTHIAERTNKELWICTEQGISILNLENNTISPFPYLDKVRVTHVLKDHNGLLWFSTYSGIFSYNEADSRITNYRNIQGDMLSLSYDQVQMCFEDKDYNLWVATQNGLNLFDREKGSFHRYFAGENTNSLSGDHIVSITQDSEGTIWVGLADAGLDIMILENNNPLKAKFRHVSDPHINCMLIDHNNILWIGNSMGMGISLSDLALKEEINPSRIYNYRNKTDNPDGLSDNTISTILEDRDGGIWIGTYAGGVNYYNPMMKKFNIVKHIPGDENSLYNNVVNCFLEDDPFFWIGTEEGLSRLDKRNGNMKTFLHQENNTRSLGANGVICIFKDSRDNLWVGTWAGGLNSYNYTRQDFTRFQVDKNKPGSISSNNVFAILEDSRGNLWIGTNGGGLNKFDYNNKTFSSYMPDPDNPNSIYHNAINDICETSQGELFISLYHALDVFDYATEIFTHYVHDDNDSTSISSGNILDIFEDSRKNLWIATSGGLNYFDRKTHSFLHINTLHGLPSNAVQAINEDNHGNLWLSTNNGLVKFESGTYKPQNYILQNFSVIDGLHGNEFIRRSTYSDKDGNLYFGGSRGYTWFHPDSIHKNPLYPEVVLTNFSLFSTSTNKSEEFELEKDINLLKEIVLTYKQSDFIIQYTALNYLNSQKNQYMYILEGFESNWHEVGNEHTATYTNIDPGRYIFKVRGSNNDGLWSKEIRTLRIIIRPPWWNTVLFKIIAALLILIMAYNIYRFRVNMLTKQKALLEEKVKERTTELVNLNSLLLEKQDEISRQNEELSKHRTNLEKIVEERTKVMKAAQRRAEEADKLKSAFLANMSHEIRTPMNAIVGFANLINNEDLGEDERKEFMGIILNNCETLMVLINDILEISLIEANQLKLNNHSFSVTKILLELESYFRLNNNKNLDITFVNRKNRELMFYNDSTRFRQVFVNLIGNACKYTEKGKIEFGYEKNSKGEITFFVKDTGIGIAESEYENIFNYFHKIDKGDNQLYRGAGIGLSISNKLVELMGGSIWLNSKIGEGTTFYFTLSNYRDETAVRSKSPESIKPRSLIYPSLKNKTIIVAEDDPTNFMLIEKILRKTKADVLWARNGMEAVELVRNPSFAGNILVLMDIKMPMMNGIRASELIKQYNSQIPVIAVTAYAQHQNREKILRHNFVDYIPKPLNSEKLLAAVYKQLKEQ